MTQQQLPVFIQAHIKTHPAQLLSIQSCPLKCTTDNISNFFPPPPKPILTIRSKCHICDCIWDTDVTGRIVKLLALPRIEFCPKCLGAIATHKCGA